MLLLWKISVKKIVRVNCKAIGLCLTTIQVLTLQYPVAITPNTNKLTAKHSAQFKSNILLFVRLLRRNLLYLADWLYVCMYVCMYVYSQLLTF